MYRVVFAAVAAMLTFGTAYQEDNNSNPLRIPEPRNQAEVTEITPQAQAQIAGVEQLIRTLEGTLAQQNQQNESISKAFDNLQNTVKVFEGAVGDIKNLNERVEAVALVATQATDNDVALSSRVSELEKTVEALKRELETYKSEQGAKAAAAAAQATPPTPTPTQTPAQSFQGNYPAYGTAPVASGGSTGGYAQRPVANGGSTGSYPARAATASGGCTGTYGVQSGYTAQAVTTTVTTSGGSTGGYTNNAYNPVPTVSYDVAPAAMCYDSLGNLVPCYNATSSNYIPVSNGGQAVYCVDEFGNQVPCNTATASSKYNVSTTTGGPLRNWLRNRRGG